jgi:hypothetical protein
MKKEKVKIMVIAFIMTLALACEKEDFTFEGVNEKSATGDFVKREDTTFPAVPDVLIEDSTLQNYASVSQLNEDYLTYLYNRAGKVSVINYFKRYTITSASITAVTARKPFMSDRFVYDNTGKLIELSRLDLTVNPSTTGLKIVKKYKYDMAGLLTEIITRKPGGPVEWEKREMLYYDKSGRLTSKIVKESNQPLYYFKYGYDDLNRLVSIAGYQDDASQRNFVCNLFYDNRNNIERKEFFYLSLPTTTSDMVRRWVVYFKYDRYRNPFKNLRLPVSSLFEWMDVISPGNITSISFNNSYVDNYIDRFVQYKYRYNSIGFPVMRYRVNDLTNMEEVND